MSNLPNSTDENSSLNSILLKREAALLPGGIPSSRPPSASSAGSFQFVPGVKDTVASVKIDKALGSKGESGGGYTGENKNLMSVLVDSRAAASSKKIPSTSTPKSLLYQLYFVTAHMIDTNDICGGKILSKTDSFCAKSVANCKVRSHQEKHKACKENTVFIIGRSTTVNKTSTEKIINPEIYYIEIPDENYDTARELLKTFNGKLFGVRNIEKTYKIFNEFCEEFHSTVRATNAIDMEEDSKPVLAIEPQKRNAETGLFSTKVNLRREPRDGTSGIESASSDSSIDSNDTDLSTDSVFLQKGTMLPKTTEVEEKYIIQGMKFGLDFEKDPTKQISLLGALLLKQEDTIKTLSKSLEEFANQDVVSSSQLNNSLSPLKSDIRNASSTIERTKTSFDRYKRKHSEERIIAATKKDICEDIDAILEEKLIIFKEETDVDQSPLLDETAELSDKIDKLEVKLLAFEAGSANSGSIFPTTTFTTPLLPDVVRNSIASIEFKLALLESRVGSQMIKFGNVTLRSLVDTELFVNDHVPSFSYGCFFDLVALLDSLRDTTTTEKSFLESEYNAQKTKFVSVDEASTSASFLHVAPLVFCGNSSSLDSKYGSIERSLPNVKTREHWVSLGGMEGMKRQLEEEVTSKVGAILEEIPMTLGSSDGAHLAKAYLSASQTCFHKFVTWTESFYQELIGTSKVTEQEAWTLILHCWMAFFADLRQIRVACANLSPGRHEVGTVGRTRIVARYIWTMGKAILLQNEYCLKQFRNHPSISTVINYHLFQHRVPMTLYKTMMTKLETEVKGINAWKAQMGRDIKDIRKLAGDRS